MSDDLMIPSGATHVPTYNKLTAEDKLLIKTLETEAYKVKDRVADSQAAFKGAVDALNSAIKQLADRCGYDLKEYRIDLEKMEFVHVPQANKPESVEPAAPATE